MGARGSGGVDGSIGVSTVLGFGRSIGASETPGNVGSNGCSFASPGSDAFFRSFAALAPTPFLRLFSSPASSRPARLFSSPTPTLFFALFRASTCASTCASSPRARARAGALDGGSRRHARTRGARGSADYIPARPDMSSLSLVPSLDHVRSPRLPWRLPLFPLFAFSPLPNPATSQGAVSVFGRRPRFSVRVCFCFLSPLAALRGAIFFLCRRPALDGLLSAFSFLPRPRESLKAAALGSSAEDAESTFFSSFLFCPSCFFLFFFQLAASLRPACAAFG